MPDSRKVLPKTTLSQATAVMLVLTVAAVGYFIVDALRDKNAIEQRRVELEYQAQKDKLEYEQQREQEARQAEEAKQAENQLMLENCLVVAQKNYDANWDTSCATQSKNNEQAYKNCLAVCSNIVCDFGSDDVAYCRRLHPAKPTTDCALPAATAERWDDALADEKARCYQQYGNS